MANYSANIQLVVQGQDRLKYVLNSVEKLNTILSRLKPINLLAPGRGSGADVIGQAKKQLDDFSRAIVNFKPEGIQKRAKELSNTLAGSAAQADALTIALENVGLKTGGFSKQAAEVKNYALALEQARRNAERLSAIGQQVQRGARIQTIAERFNVSPVTVEERLNSLRNARYAKDKKAEAERYMALKREEDFELRLQKIREKNAAAQQRQQVQKEAVSNAIIGGAFPLLFGQGIGAAVGGGAGGALGGLLGGQFGFGLSLVGTAIGQTFDNATQSAKDFTKALKDTGDASGALEAALGTVDKSTKTAIQNLAASGQTAAAAEASFAALAEQIGYENAEAFKRAGESTNKWGSNFQTWLTKLYAQAVRLAEFVRDNFPTGAGLQQNSVFDITEAQPTQPITQEAQDRLENLAGQNTLLEKQVALSRLTADASIDQRLQLERQVALQEYVNEATALEQQLKQKLLSQQEYTLRLKTAELSFTRQIYNLENAAQQDRQRKAEETRRLAEKAQREAEQAAKERLQVLNNIRNLEVQLSKETLTAGDIDLERTTAVEGQVAALKESLTQQQARLNIEARILDIQLEQALSAEKLTAQERSLLESVYKQQRANLEEQNKTKFQTLQLDLARLQTARAIAAQEGPRQIRDINQQRTTQLAGLQAEIQNPFGGDTLDRFNQQLDQLARRYETLVPLQDELTNLQIERSYIAESASKEELFALDERINKTTAAIQLEGQYLNQIDATEQALLRQQQVYAKYGFIADEISRALSDSITGLITGTTTVAEAFSRMFANIGKAFIDLATQMLAQKLVFSLIQGIVGGITGGLGNPAGSGGGVLPGGWQQYAGGFGGGGAPGSMPFAPPAFAEGGFVTGPTRALIGEGGEPEYVIPASKMRTAMGRYSAGARGSSVVAGTGGQGSGEAGSSAATMAPIEVRYSVERINSVDYVTADEFQRGMAQAAQQGAKQGETRALRKLQMSSSTRRRLGV